MKKLFVALVLVALVIATPSVGGADTKRGRAFKDRLSERGSAISAYRVNGVMAEWVSGDPFGAANPTSFSLSAWSSSGGATWAAASDRGADSFGEPQADRYRRRLPPDRRPPPIPVPEPASILLFGTGLAGFIAAVHRRRK